jgi:radical SAM superfamily enzyme with C-terminal helix-hairpin-helix motif
MRASTGFAIAAALFLTLGAGCSERRMNRAYREVTGKPARPTVELNSASGQQLAQLPGLTDEDANRIIANRPYQNKNALLRKKVLGKKKFEAIEDYVYVARGPGYED